MPEVIMEYERDTKRFHRYSVPEPAVFTAPITGGIYVRKSDQPPPKRIKVTVEPIKE